MKLIVGLGNPGRIYKYSRHNIGSLLIDKLSKKWGVRIKSDQRLKSRWGKGIFEDKEVILAYPLSFMNLSGYSVSLILRKFDLRYEEDILIVYDDLDLEYGRIRIRPRGDAGGHKGLDSIIRTLGSSNFSRLRIGIGRPPQIKKICESKRKKEIVNYVLGSWTRQERSQLGEYLERAADCCRAWVIWDISKAMDGFN